jgi:hypothetical protein
MGKGRESAWPNNLRNNVDYSFLLVFGEAPAGAQTDGDFAEGEYAPSAKRSSAATREAMDGRARRILTWMSVDDGVCGRAERAYGAFARSTGAGVCAPAGQAATKRSG